MKAPSCSVFIAAITLVSVLQYVAAQVTVTLTPGGFGPVSSSATGPRIVWTPPDANASGNFTLTSEARSDSSRRYVSFAFASDKNMVKAMTVVDCIEVDGNVTLGTSRNAKFVGDLTNFNDDVIKEDVQLLSTSKLNGVLTCTFSMMFPPTLDVYVLLAAGELADASSASPLKKFYHTPSGRFFSTSTLAQMLASTATVTTSTAVPINDSLSSSAHQTLMANGFTISSPSAAGPRVLWTRATINSLGNFTITSEASKKSFSRYVSFAFSSGMKMEDALMVVDCYDVGGTAMLGTSRNNHDRSNVNDPSTRSQVQLLSATNSDGVLTCSFSMKFPSTLDVYLILATGPMAAGANATHPQKLPHGPNGRFVSDSTFVRHLNTASATAFSSTVFVILAAITPRAISWL